MTQPAPRPTDSGIVPLTVIGAFLTDAGPTRPANEDSVSLTTPEDLPSLMRKGVLAIVADGMGGHEGGEIASGIAVRIVSEVYYRHDGDPQESLVAAFTAANREIFTEAHQRSKLVGMGTTCTAVAVVNGLAYCAHIGDSRAYLIRGGTIYCMTEDHSATRELVKQGRITLAEARDHEERNIILRAMGTRKQVEAAHWQTPFPMRPGDHWLLCSDGLYEIVEESEMAQVVAAHTPEESCRKLIKLANDRIGSDNVSVAILRFREAGGAA